MSATLINFHKGPLHGKSTWFATRFIIYNNSLYELCESNKTTTKVIYKYRGTCETVSNCHITK